jgi:phenylacetate-CoA ligase
MVYKRTGGSTSVPLVLYVDYRAADWKAAATIRHNRWAGYDRGDKLAAIWGDTEKKYSAKEMIYNFLNARTIYLDTLIMTEQYILEFIEKTRRFKPKIMMGHAHSLYALACFVEEHNITDLGIKGIISSAEILYDHERAKIESVFGKILFNRYGCEELSIIASECERHDGLHINAEGLYVEVIGGDDMTPGKLVITDLWNRGMPFIRYEIGDMATTRTGTCSCGRGLPRLGKIYGRTADLLYTPDGRTISGISVLDTFTIHVPGIKQVQIIQNELNKLDFKIVKTDDFNDESLRILSEKIPFFFGSSMLYDIEFVDKIAQTARGKYRFSICNIPGRAI